MKNLIKKILLIWFALLSLNSCCVLAADWDAPSFEDNFSHYFRDDTYSVNWVSSNNSFKENIQALFYPNFANGRWWALWDFLLYIWYALIIIFIVRAWMRLLLKWSNAETVKSAFSSLLYILLWALLFFWAIWILRKLNLGDWTWTTWLADSLQNGNKSLLFFILSFAKAFAFIAAIVMIVVHWFKMFSSADKSDKVKTWFKWLFNVIVALVIIKLIDYIYYIAQMSDLVDKATDLIIEIAKVIWFIIWALMVIMLLYAGFLFLTDQWSSEQMKKAKNIIIWILVSALVIFALLLIIYEIFNEFVPST